MKQTIQSKLANRKYKRPNKIIYWIVARIVAPLVMKSYGKQYISIKDKITTKDGPKFLIFNHQSRFDWVMLTKATFPERLNYVIGYNEHFRKKFHFVFKILNMIPKKNFAMDIPSIRAIDSIIKQGGIVTFSPEGMSSITGYNQPIVPNTGKFFKHYGIPVYILKNKGGYLVNHKVCLDTRKGPVYSELSCLFSKEQLEKLSDEEIQLKTDEALWQDDYEWNKKEQHIYKNMDNVCSHMDDLAYLCPKCHTEFVIKAKGNKITCEKCGNEISINCKYEMIASDGSIGFDSLAKWVEFERGVEIKRIREDQNYEYVEENCLLGELPKYHYLSNNKTSEPCGNGTIKINHQGFEFNGIRHNKPFSFKLDYKALTTLVIVTDCQAFGLYVEGEFLEIKPSKKSVGKILLMVEEFSRFRYNLWPNFPWMSHLYK